ncbi:hypothetical protein [Muricoccus vinaceus]|uniref:SMODS-associating 2TM beta-strand rich effector domain-containing protein n=1 Tax=Muricoccus vinaceus TaxID=424704 RepID=A0ABV6J191_9PROT
MPIANTGAVDTGAVAPANSQGSSAAIFRTVQHVHAIERWTDWTLMALACLLASIAFALNFYERSSWSDALLNGVFTLFLGVITARILYRVIYALALWPYRVTRFRGCEKKIGQFFDQRQRALSMLRTWRNPSPGAMAVLGEGRLAVVSFETRYEELNLKPEQIASARVEREQTLHTVTQESGRFTVGAGGSLFLGYTFGGKSRSKTTVDEYAYLEIQYQLSPNGSVRWLAIPFGSARQEAESWAVAISRMSTPVLQ